MELCVASSEELIISAPKPKLLKDGSKFMAIPTQQKLIQQLTSVKWYCWKTFINQPAAAADQCILTAEDPHSGGDSSICLTCVDRGISFSFRSTRWLIEKK